MTSAPPSPPDRQPRISANDELQLTAEGRSALLQMRDLSMGGFATYASHPFKAGRVQRFTLAVPARRLTVTLDAIAVYSRAIGAYRGVISFLTGWKFMPLPLDAQATIEAIIELAAHPEENASGPADHEP